MLTALYLACIRQILNSESCRSKGRVQCIRLVPTILKFTGMKHIYDNDGKDTKDDTYMLTLGNEMKNVLALVTHMKLKDLVKTRREVLAGRKRYPHGLIAHQTLEDLHVQWSSRTGRKRWPWPCSERGT